MHPMLFLREARGCLLWKQWVASLPSVFILVRRLLPVALCHLHWYHKVIVGKMAHPTSAEEAGTPNTVSHSAFFKKLVLLNIIGETDLSSSVVTFGYGHFT